MRCVAQQVNRLKRGRGPGRQGLGLVDVADSSTQPKVFDYLSSLEWIRTQQNPSIIRPAGTGNLTPRSAWSIRRCSPLITCRGSSTDDHGHAAVSINNPDTATRNATYAPGPGRRGRQPWHPRRGVPATSTSTRVASS
jgi:hypothetical protein